MAGHLPSNLYHCLVRDLVSCAAFVHKSIHNALRARYCPGEWAVVRHAYVVGVGARAVLVTPLSGPLARFGKAGASALALWADRSGVSLEVIDAHPSAASAMRAAEACGPDVLFGP